MLPLDSGDHTELFIRRRLHMKRSLPLRMHIPHEWYFSPVFTFDDPAKVNAKALL